MALKYQILYEQDIFYDCIVEALGSRRISWKPDVPMQRRLAIRNNRDHARSLKPCVSRLEELAQLTL